jgi:Domain of unknown function (DUF5069)
MNLPHPREELAGCCWLPRLAAKARAGLNGELPLSYRVAFGSRVGIDGYFLRHFRLTHSEFIAATRAAADNEALAKWFLARPPVTATSIAAWNELAPRLGARHSPGYMTRHLVKWVLYPKSVLQPVGSIFEAIEQDENLRQPKN